MSTVVIMVSLTILANALANVFLKLGTQKLPALTAVNLAANLPKIFTNGWIILGALLLITNFPLYNLLLQRLRLAIAFPLIMTGAFAVTLLVSVFVFQESMRLPHYFGLILFALALWFLAR